MYNWIQTTFEVSDGLAQGLALVISLAVVIVLFGLFVFIIKRLMGANAPQSRGRQPRIALMDSAAIDNRRRLLLVRRDNVEHLILVGGPSDVVVEQNIVRAAPLPAGQPRPAPYPAAQPSAAIKAPLAPGPDIPLTPEDTAHAASQAPAQPVMPAAEQPVTQPAALQQAAPPSTHRSSQPGSQTPTGAQTPPTTAGRPAGYGTAKPSAPPASAHPAPPAPAPQATALPATQPAPQPPALGMSARTTMGSAASSPTASAAPPPAKPLSAPAPLIATRDNPAPSQAAGNPVLKAEPRDLSPSAATSRVEVAPPSEPNTAQEGQAASPLRALTRPFSPKDRPSYGSAKISPPASGPAARAKTALLTPVDSDTAAPRFDPAMNAQETSTVAAAPVVTVPAAAKNSPLAAATLPVQTPSKAPDPAPIKTEPPETAAESLEQELFEELEPGTTASEAGPAAGDQPSEEKPGETVAAAPAPAQPEDMKKADPVPAEQLVETAGETPKKAGTAAASPPDKGLGDRNPIEAEMAKILDELGGQPKQ